MADAVTPLFAVARNTGRTFRTAALSYLAVNHMLDAVEASRQLEAKEAKRRS